ncbi:hypothetical protein ACK4CS_16545 [Enterococcus gallinarum]|uniref:Uncharacterized protein n=1 Tax=Enterococcus gallinarum TaxID=1353 RepID=A0A6I4XV03_ENTGA|nr:MULTISPECIES: hypothetical protein [Enterococcus]MBF0822465.1 hypothetical protein [Enterococcus faecalis]MBF0726039.1 hypothetical protein [Enterococcus gallinarum]MBF0796679.1 hypothetical protein [Enterococcus gallinarum]MBS7180914.1 hypothetical protein [Enterococcus gallinarum]MBX8977554.1 hypothetical protein [Enterococcus gallinarum]
MIDQIIALIMASIFIGLVLELISKNPIIKSKLLLGQSLAVASSTK